MYNSDNENLQNDAIEEDIPEVIEENIEESVNTPLPQPEYAGYGFYQENKKSKKKYSVWIGALAGALAGIIVTLSVGAALLIKYDVIKLPDVMGNFNKEEYYNAENSFEFSQLTDGERKPKPLVDIAAEVGPSVVMVTTTSTVNSIFGTSLQQGSGSGIIISEDGYIVTNNHVINNSQIVKVVLSDGREFNATVIGGDAKTDIAVLKIDGAGDLTVAVMGDSDKIQVGELAIAIGNPLGSQLTGTVTQGVISAVNRTVEASENTYVNLIQTDAAINNGNSGGALVNGYGEIIGVNTVKYAASGVEGIGFAIPINDVMPIVEDLISKGYVSGRPLIGVKLIEVTEQLASMNNLPVGLYVASVEPDSAAQRGGIKNGDVIVKVNGDEVKTVDALNEIRDSKKVGDMLVFEVYRNGKNVDVVVILQEDRPVTER